MKKIVQVAQLHYCNSTFFWILAQYPMGIVYFIKRCLSKQKSIIYNNGQEQNMHFLETLTAHSISPFNL